MITSKKYCDIIYTIENSFFRELNMLTDEERIKAMHERAHDINRKRQKRKVAAAGILSTAFCLMIVITTALLMPKLNDVNVSGGDAIGMNASIFTGTAALGYIVIGILAFILGVAVTIFCFRFKKKQDENDRTKDFDD